MADLDELRKVNNLQRAWRWIRYPAIFALAKEVHEARYLSMYSHPRVGKTTKPTKKISYRFLGKAKGLLKAAVTKLKTAGLPPQ